MVLSIVAYLPGPEAAKHHYTIARAGGVMFLWWNAVSFTPDVTGPMSLNTEHL